MQTKLTKRLKKSCNFLTTFFGILTLSLLFNFSHILYAQEEEITSFDESVVKNGESLFRGNCTVCHAIDEVVIGPALRDVHERQSEEWIYAFIKNTKAKIIFI